MFVLLAWKQRKLNRGRPGGYSQVTQQAGQTAWPWHRRVRALPCGGTCTLSGPIAKPGPQSNMPQMLGKGRICNSLSDMPVLEYKPRENREKGLSWYNLHLDMSERRKREVMHRKSETLIPNISQHASLGWHKSFQKWISFILKANRKAEIFLV